MDKTQGPYNPDHIDHLVKVKDAAEAVLRAKKEKADILAGLNDGIRKLEDDLRDLIAEANNDAPRLPLS